MKLLFLAILAIQAAQADACYVQAAPLPMKLAEDRLAVSRAPFGFWTITVACEPGAKREFSGEALVIAIATHCRRNRIPVPLFLPKEIVAPVLLRKTGGRLNRIATYAGPAAAISAGIPWLAAIAPVFDLMGRAAGRAVPSVADLSLEIPSKVEIPETGGKTLLVWSAKMRKAPEVIGPFEMGGKP
jgi:hypothetical protein